MTTGEIVSLIGLAISAAAFVTGSVVFFKNMGRDAADRGGRNAKLESKLDFIKIQTELISAKSNAISEKLEVINHQLAQRKTTMRKIVHWICIALCVAVVMIFAALTVLKSPYLGWDASAPETAVIRVGVHTMEWIFVRAAPLVLLGGIVGAFSTRKKE